jgi:hypothetical protein
VDQLVNRFLAGAGRDHGALVPGGSPHGDGLQQQEVDDETGSGLPAAVGHVVEARLLGAAACRGRVVRLRPSQLSHGRVVALLSRKRRSCRVEDHFATDGFGLRNKVARWHIDILEISIWVNF